MDLIKCDDCRHDISPRAAFCPGCGAVKGGSPLYVSAVDIDIGFGNMVGMMVKAALAAIPAAIIVAAIGALLWAAVTGMLHK